MPVTRATKKKATTTAGESSKRKLGQKGYTYGAGDDDAAAVALFLWPTGSLFEVLEAIGAVDEVNDLDCCVKAFEAFAAWRLRSIVAAGLACDCQREESAETNKSDFNTVNSLVRIQFDSGFDGTCGLEKMRMGWQKKSVL